MALAILVGTAVTPFASPALATGSTTPSFTVYTPPAGVGEQAGEPSIGFNPATGNAFYQALIQTLRVRFDDSGPVPSATWTDVSSPFTNVINVDPYLFTDQVSGRTFAGGITHGCSLMAYTDDDGDTWYPMVDACSLPAFDHESLASGPWAGNPPPGAIHDRAVYYCAQESIQQCAVSFDGGLTFHPAPIVGNGPLGNPCNGHIFRVRVAADGTAYAPQRTCAGKRGLATSVNNGLTWTGRVVPGTNVSAQGFDPGVEMTPSGRTYYAWQGVNNHTYVTVGTNSLTVWSTPVDISPGLKSTSFASVVTGDDDRAAVAFLGTADSGAAFSDGFAGTWYLYVAYTYDGGATWTTVQATPDPVQRGKICAGGTGCSSGRNLLDFIDATVDSDGRVLVAYADGCVGWCASASGTAVDSTSSLAAIARQTCGASLFAAKGNIQGSGTCPGAVSSGYLGGAGTGTVLSGSYYAHSLAPVGNVHKWAAIAGPVQVPPHASLDSTPPGLLPPKIWTEALLRGTSTGTNFDANFYLAAPPTDLLLQDATVTARIWIAGVASAPPTTGTITMLVGLYDTNGVSSTLNPDTAAIAKKTVTIPQPVGPTEVVVTFEHVNATITQALDLFIQNRGSGNYGILYDSALTPTGIEIS